MIEQNVPQVNLDTKTRVKSILGGSAGNLVEWYDWYVYAAFTLYFAHAFFPKGSQTAQLLQAAAIFAVGFLMRPIGAWIMGIYSDKKGRKIRSHSFCDADVYWFPDDCGLSYP